MKDYDYVLVYPKPSFDSPNKLVPLSILYPGAKLEEEGHEVEYVDCRFEPETKVYELAKNTDNLGVSCMTGFQLGEAVRILKRVKEINPDIKTLLGGYHATLLPEQCLKEPLVDDVHVGRMGEELFPYNEKTKKYFEWGDLIWFSSTGCFHRCGFCCIEKKWRPKNLERFKRELSIIHDDIGFGKLVLGDPNLGKKEDRIKEMGKFFRGRDIQWHCNIRCDYIDDEFAKLLEWANCYSVELGCESGSNRILREVIRKGHGTSAILEAVKSFSKTRISVMCSFMVDLPTETREEVLMTLDLIDEIRKINKNARVSIYRYTPYPKTSMLEMAIREGFEEPRSMLEWSRIGMHVHPLYWIAGLKFRKDNIKKNFRGVNRLKILPFEMLADAYWRFRITNNFPSSMARKVIEKRV
ncbi:MAG: B12-binding domain-containing radical SAM protein [Candidatus Zixiibacteriota bacterium]